MHEGCQSLQGQISAVAVNPFHIDPGIKERVMRHISTCLSCRGRYGQKVRARKQLEKDGYDPTHHRI